MNLVGLETRADRHVQQELLLLRIRREENGVLQPLGTHE